MARYRSAPGTGATSGVLNVAPAQVRQAAMVLVAGSFCVTLAAWSQTSIRIPDFRQPPPPVATFKAGEPCIDCGRITSIKEVQTDRRPNTPQAFQGPPGSSGGMTSSNLVGAVVYLPLGGDSTSREKPFVGGVGTPEMRERFRESTYEVTVRMDDGAFRFVQRHDGTRYHVGDRVRLSGVGQLELVADR